MAIRIKWDKYEVALLLYSYVNYVKDNADANRAIIAEELSLKLRNRAIRMGIKIDDIFRNKQGVFMRLSNIEYAFTNGQKGLSNFSNLDEDIITLYRDNFDQFKLLVEECERQCGTNVKEPKKASESTNVEDDAINNDNNHPSKSQKYIIEETTGSEENLSLANELKIDIESLKNIKISECGFSVRLENTIKREYKTDNLYDIANYSITQIKQTKGLGANSIAELIKQIKTIGEPLREDVNEKKNTELEFFMKKYRLELASGDLSSIEKQLSSEKEYNLFKELSTVYDDIGEEIATQCITDAATIIPLLNALNKFVSDYNKEKNVKNLIIKAINDLPLERRKIRAKYFIEIYGQNKRELNEIFNYGANELSRPDHIKNEQVNILLQFYKWCCFDIQTALSEIHSKGFTNEREKGILEMRSKGATLEQAGTVYNITRERVRQIEAKSVSRFFKRLNLKKILEFIYADNSGITIFSKDSLKTYFKDNVELFIYLLLTAKCPEFQKYDKYDVYFILCEDGGKLLDACLDELPDRFYEEDKQKLIESLSEKFMIPQSVINSIILEEYNNPGAAVYSRSTVSLKDIYIEQIGKHFPAGIHIYDKKDLQKLKNCIIKNYGEEKIAKTDRAITARISDVCILCGKGIYKIKQDRYISSILKDKIYKYIIESEHQIFLTNTIFSVFESELKQEGIDNKYYLQGIIKEEFGNEFYTRRDYISKNKELTSIYDEIYSFIQKSKYPVTKEELKEQFPGITEIVLNLAINTTGILNLFGSYIHVDNLDINDGELKYLKDIARHVCSDNLTHHVKDIFSIAKMERPDILNKNYIKYAHDLYSLLEWALSDEGYQFDRPYMAKQGINMVHPKDALNEYIINSDEISIKEIMDFAHDDYIMIQSILEFLNTFNDTHFFKDDKNLIKIEKTGLTEEIYGLVEERMMKEVVETIPIAKLNCVHEFEKINIQWTEWLIYSAVNKWSDCLEVAASDKELRKSIPLIAPKGELEVTNKYNKSTVGTISNVDDLTNIEELVSEYIFEEMEMLWDNEF